MIEHEYKFRVMYPETDQMGTVHHSNYLKYYETARWELFRSIGIPYKFIEDAGYMLPVIKMSSNFKKTIGYDSLLTIKTSLILVKGVRIHFSYKLFNEQNELINEGDTELAFVRKVNWKPCGAPDFVINAIDNYIKNPIQ